nr:PREDICTED: uncharacterized protein LOC107399294 [Tribolium castaneum]|eukprot:XP_015840966.1 PREDICTED: uncharacterized protein LOC107399294 [Tribolium castaneum]
MKRSHFNKPLEFVILVAKILGIVPLSSGPQRKRVRVLLILKQVLGFCGIVFICWLHFFHYSCTKIKFSYLSSTISSILNVGYNVLMCIGTYLISILYEKKYRSVSVVISSFDQSMESRVKSRKKISTVETIVFGLSVTFVLVILCVQFGHYFRNYRRNNFCILFTVLSLVITTVVFLLNFVLLIGVSKRFKLLNKYFKSIIFLAVDYENSNVSLVRETEECSKLCHMLMVTAELVNQIFELFIAIDFMIFFCLLIFLIFYLSADNDTFRDRFPTKIEMYTMFFWTLVAFLKTVLTTYAFKSVATEANHYNRIVHSIRSESVIPKNLVITISHQLNFYSSQFTVFEMFPLEWSNLFTILVSAMMYSIFFLQLNGGKNYILFLS